ncbi:hypothetical protein D9613_004969 [Agrocybe pediades]|uniref:Uncharacterized protein n=1 Tax=Agrocybe pediades TaxID=84607 RepID=A0A8H4QY33_9AGAR|nr:hypothetical protein D9613_004969 [Agrocybe pediades]KAF9567394.1 hypothetical protein CPC08DRAFT_758352 [Agrocybe pediades]
MSTSEKARLLLLPVNGAPSSTRGMRMTMTTNLSYPSRLHPVHVPWSAPAALSVFPKTPISRHEYGSQRQTGTTFYSTEQIGRYLMFIL